MKNEKIDNTEKTILVLGGTGKTGNRIVKRLYEKNYPTRIGSRSADPGFDWENRNTWKPALQNIYSVYIAFQPDLAVPGSVETIAAFVKLAVESGVKKIVLLSGRGEIEAQQCEKTVIESELDWTIVRASWFNQNFSESYLLAPLVSGHVALPAGKVGEPFVDANDIADVAVAALTEEGHNKQIYEVTGSRLWTFEEVVTEISHATGRKIVYQQITMKEFADSLAEHGVPTESISLLTYLFTEVLDGRNAYISDGVERALGRKPTDFAKFVENTKASGVWDPQAVSA